MESPTIIVVAIDGWRARSLGAYGNTWFGTPALDRFASQSLVYEQVLAESNCLSKVYVSLWTGRHLLDHESQTGDNQPLPKSLVSILRDGGYACGLVTDEATVAKHELAGDFDRVQQVDSANHTAAVDALATSFAKVLEAAANVAGEWASEYEQPRLLWIHLRGFTSEWDAPSEFSESLVDEDDPELKPSIKVPQGVLSDPDLASDDAFLASCRYSGQVMALDQCWGAFDNLLTELWPQTPPHVVLCGTRGFELGEHNSLGFSTGAYSPQFHIPLVVRDPVGHALQRDHRLLQTSDVSRMLASMAVPDTAPAPPRTLAAGESDLGDRFLRTDSWHYIAGDEQATKVPQLFVKPDDLWEANDVASLCATELTQFAQLEGKLRELATAGIPWESLSPQSSTVTAES